MTYMTRASVINYDQEAEIEEEEAYLKSRIINVLKNYPVLSPSMLQLGIGPAIKSRVWKPILEDLIKEGCLEREFISIPSERGGYRTICRLKLSEHFFADERDYVQSSS